MDSSDYIQLLILILLIGLSAFFSSAETALTTVNKIRIRNLAEAGDKSAVTLTKVLEDQGKMLSAILVGNNVVNLTASSMSTTLAMNIWSNKAVGIATGVLTLVILVFGEISPKTISTLYSEKISLKYAKFIYLFMTVMTPVIYAVNVLSSGFLRLVHVDPNRKQEAITEDELRTIVEVSHEEGVIESEEKKIINNVFDFGDSVAKDIMVPRIDMAMVEVDATYDELIDIFREEKYTRMPVYEETTDNVIGIINMKDVLLIDRNEEFHIRDLLREPLYTYEYKNTAELMVEMRQTSNNMIIVLDEYGATAGMITLEDLLEEIVGEIRDEYDEDEEQELVKVGPGEYVVEGSMKLDDLNDQLDLELESEDYDSIGGLIIGQLDRLPEEGESVVCDGIRLVVDRLDKNRIDRVHMYLPNEQNVDA
ncbi:MAG: hemolysin family protein [Clostridiales bacterium]|nr:hemolysin family protein [Clostridiales bacterium]